MASLLFCSGVSADQADRPQLDRPVPIKPQRTVVTAGMDDQRVVVKFTETSAVRLERGRWISKGEQLFSVDAVVTKHAATPSRLIGMDRSKLQRIHHAAARRSGRRLADVSLYYELALPAPEAAELCDELNALPAVELAYPAPGLTPPPGDIPPTTPDFRDLQGYAAPGPEGIDAPFAWNFPGGRGQGISIIDIEFDWYDTHEDLERSNGKKLVFEPQSFFPDHGTAVLGQLISSDDVWGVTGLVPDAEIGMISQFPVGMSNSVARAIVEAVALLEPGDVLLIEAQVFAFDDDLVPVEWFLAEYDAISLATASGIVVIEPAGNGAVDLDGPLYDPAFDRSFRDSGAIVVGAGHSPEGLFRDRTRIPSSNFGSRVDVQGWGRNVMTTGYGLHWSGDDEHRQDYDREFDGTSAASAQAAAAAAALQGIVTSRGEPALRPTEVRRILAETGSPQQTGMYAGNIGTRPDLREAVRSISKLLYDAHVVDDAPPGGNGDGQLDPGETVSLSVCLHNGHADSASGIVASLGGMPQPWLRVTEDRVRFPDLSPGGTICSETAITVVVQPDAPCGAAVHLELALASDRGMENTSLRMTVGRDGVCSPFLCATGAPGEIQPTLLVEREAETNLRLTWDPVFGATSYRVWVSNDAGFTDALLAEQIGAGSSTALLAGERAVKPPLRFYLVRAINECGWEGP